MVFYFLIINISCIKIFHYNFFKIFFRSPKLCKINVSKYLHFLKYQKEQDHFDLVIKKYNTV